ncbi:MAG: alpha/beta hydrolase [Anaerolineales bacterium]|nr:alpha/beta hydrolase [Anaerolineales bacterium]
MPTSAGLYYFSNQEEDTNHPPVILIHGAGGAHLHWPPQIRRLTGHRIYAVDLPGHGESEGLGKQSIDEYTDVLIEFTRATKLRTFIVVGHSMGGAIALSLALKRPKRVLGLGLVSAGSRLRVTPALLEMASNPAAFDTLVSTLIELSYSPGVEPRMKEQARQNLAETRPTVLHGDLLACDAFDCTEQLNKVSAPTLLLCGTEDKLTPPHFSEFLRDNIPGAVYQPIENAGHMAMIEQPEQAAQHLADFINAIPLPEKK